MKNVTINVMFPLSMITILVISFMSNDLFIPSMPQLVAYYNISANSIQNAISFWFYGAMVLQIFLGPISDQYGRKPILLFSIIVLVLSSVFCGYSSTFSAFLIGRFLQGVGVSGIMVSAFAALHEVYEKENNGTKILGYVGLCTALSPLAGPLIGGYIAAYLGWQANFFGVAIIGMVLLLLLMVCVPESAISAEKPQWRMLLNGYHLLLQDNVFVVSVVCYGCLFFSGGVFLAVAAFVFVDILSLPIEYVGYMMMPMFIAYMVTSGLAEKVEKRFSATKVIMVSLIVLSLIMIIFISGSCIFERSLAFVFFGVVSYYLALGLVGPPLNNISLSRATSENKGSASAVLTVIMMLGSALGANAMSYFYDARLLSMSIVFSSGIFMACIVFSLYRLNAWSANKHVKAME